MRPPSDRKREKRRIAISANFTAEPLEESLSFWMEKLELPYQIEFAPYNQIFQQLLEPSSLMRSNRDGINIILLRVEDWLRFEDRTGPDQVLNALDRKKLEGDVRAFLRALKSSLKNPGSYFLCLCPHSPGVVQDSELSAFVSKLDSLIMTEIEAFKGVHLLDLSSLAVRYQVKQIFDPKRDELGHIPFTPEYFAAMGTYIARNICALRNPSRKVIAVDCDQTLWKGVCGEDGPMGVQIEKPYRDLQQFLVQRQETGVLLSLCSKNNEDDVLAVFRQHPEMPLKSSHILTSRINWKPKSENLKDIARELQLSLDSFIFLDDNPVECAEVRARCPEVLAFELPRETKKIPAFLENLWVFDRLHITEEDKIRTESYRQNKERNQLQRESPTLEGFLAGLNLAISIVPMESHQLERVAQLTQRTNQFNATTIRRTENEIEQVVRSEKMECWAVQVSDRFGDYGLVGVIIIDIKSNVLEVDTFLLSCRVLGKRVEHVMLEKLATIAKDRNCAEIKLFYRPTKKNSPIHNFLKTVGAKFMRPSEEGSSFTFPVKAVPALISKARAADLRPTGESLLKESELPPTSMQHSASELQERIVLLSQIATDFQTADQILKAIRSRKSIRPETKHPFVLPRTALEKEVAEIWADILGLDQIGIYDNFFDLGGDSLKSAELVSRMQEIFQVNLSLSVMELPSVAKLAKAIDDIRHGRTFSTTAAPTALANEVLLDPSIKPEGLHYTYNSEPNHVFLTGASGYLGAFLLQDLLRQTRAQIYCLMRSPNEDEGMQRLKENLELYSLWDESYRSRIIPVIGDLSKPSLDLSSNDYQKIARRIDVIYHNGAWVNFIFPYSILKPANVLGTQEILKLATQSRLKPVHFISTLGILMSGIYPKDRIIREDDDLDHFEGLPNGYEQSKWVADKIVKIALSRGLPGCIYRVGMLSGNSQTGIYYKLNEILTSFIKGCLQIGCMPEVDSNMEIVPIDYASQAIVHISRQKESLGKTFHLNHPHPVHMSEFIKLIQSLGYPLRGVPFDVWKRELFSLGRQFRENALYLFSDFLEGLKESGMIMPKMECQNTLNALKGTNIKCPPLPKLLDAYFSYFIRTGFLDRPGRSFSFKKRALIAKMYEQSAP